MPSVQVSVEKITEYIGHNGSVFTHVVDAAEHYFYSADDHGVVAKWDLQKPESDGEGVIQVPHAIYSLLLVDELQLLIAGGSEGTIYFVDLKSREIVHQYRKRAHAIYKLWLAPDGKTVWALQAKGALSVIQLPDFEQVGYLPLSQENLRCITAGPQSGQVLIGASDGLIRVLDIKKGEVVHSWKAHDPSVFCLLMHPDNKMMLSGGRDAHLNIWDLKNNFAEVERIPAHNFTVNDLVLSPDHRYLLSASRDKTIKLWDADHFHLLKVINLHRNQGHKHSVNKLTWLTADNSVLSSSDDRRTIRWKIKVER